MKKIGLTSSEAEESRKKNGSNVLTEIPPEPLWKKIMEGFKDPMIMILLVALVVQVVLFFLKQSEWFEPVGILVAIIIANGVAAVSENKQENKASVLKKEAESREMAKVIRDGALTEINISDVVVGDIVYLQAGDKIAADGLVIEGSIKVDQSALNGETEEAEKTACEGECSYDTDDLLNTVYVYRGTVVCDGECYIEVKTVGDKSLYGKLALEVQEETRETPLQLKLGVLAGQISKFGYIGAVAIIIGVLLKTLISGNIPADAFGWIRLVMDAVTVAVTVIVCAVPEGLPMLTSILLSFQSLRMAKDNVLVRKINGLETAGNINILFSDKTGTITEGKLSVVEIADGNADVAKSLDVKKDAFRKHFIYGVGVNNSASYSDNSIIGGNSTDRALMSFLVENKCTSVIDEADVVCFNSFNSAKKTSSVVVADNGKKYIYIKGASENIVGRCTKYFDADGNVCELTDTNKLDAYTNAQAEQSMRLIAVAMAEGDSEDARFTLVGIVSIRDNVRSEAVVAIKEAQEAGIQVVMVTGDRKETAVAIAKEAGLLTENDIAMTSSEIAAKSDDELKAILPKIRVISRALPTDKSRLVRIAQELDMVVGMTGDGVNDAPALKKADVGFAMGGGTEVAKEAGDITILDDNFASITKAILYGRTMFKSIRKFLIFQLTVNVAAVLTCFIGPLMGENVILSVIQLLLINLAMDTLAAIAFGSEPVLKEYMKEKPIPRKENIVTKDMLTEVIIGAVYITIICLGILFINPIRSLYGDVDVTYLKSAVFATFMMAITFNGFNARTAHLNIFKDIEKNSSFLIVMGAIFVMQFVFVTFGGEALDVESLSVTGWLVSVVLAVVIIPIDLIRKLLVGGTKTN